MITIPTIQQLTVLADKPTLQQNKTIAAWKINLYTLQDVNSLELLVHLFPDSDVKNKIMTQITLRRKQLSGNKYLNFNSAKQKNKGQKSFFKNQQIQKNWKYVLVIATLPLFAFIFGGLILGRNTIEVTGSITPFQNIKSFEYLTASNFSEVGNLSAISIKTHTESLTGRGVLAGCLGIGLIITIIAWHFAGVFVEDKLSKMKNIINLSQAKQKTK